MAAFEPNSKETFEKIFHEYYQSLRGYAFSILGDGTIAEESVQEVFLNLWEHRKRITIEHSIKAYLYKAIYNKCVNHLNSQKIKSKHNLQVVRNMQTHTIDNPGSKIEIDELQEQLRQAMNALPEACRTIFHLSRFEELKYKEIADLLGLSVKTVEAQVSKALKRLRNALTEFK